jgi:hypothetical protein
VEQIIRSLSALEALVVHQLLLLLLVFKEALVKSTMAEQQLQHLHLLVAAGAVQITPVLSQADKAAQAVEVIIVLLVVKEILLTLLQIKVTMEELALIQETVGLLAEAEVLQLLELVALAQELMVLAQVAQEEMVQLIQ